MKVNSHLRVSILLLSIDSIVSFAETVIERESVTHGTMPVGGSAPVRPLSGQ